jgi:hypothetical protein
VPEIFSTPCLANRVRVPGDMTDRNSNQETQELDEVAQVELAKAFVNDVLGGHDLTVLENIFAGSYRDNDPLPLPSGRGAQGLMYIRSLVEFLANEDVDVSFVLEDVVSSRGKFAYRLFGQGTITVPDNFAGSIPQGGPLNSPKVVGGRLYVEYRSVGIFRVVRGKLVERWGSIDVR